MERGWDCLRLFSGAVAGHPVRQYPVVGTATLRLATNVDNSSAKRNRCSTTASDHLGEEEAKTI